MRLSVVVCTYSEDLYEDFLEAVESLLAQTYDDVEVVAVVDGNDRVEARAREDLGGRDAVTVLGNDENVGLSASRNRGIEHATGDVVAFVDDDAVADDEWAATLVEAYRSRDVVAVGGRMDPMWLGDRPRSLPEEFYWLIGVTYRGYPTEPGFVRNTFGSNISFRRDVLVDLGGFDTGLGRHGESLVQGEEAELCDRLRSERGERVFYEPDAVVYHKIFEFRTRPSWLLERAFWQGYTKRYMGSVEDGDDRESEYLGALLFDHAPSRLAGLVSSPSVAGVLQFVMLWILTAAVGFGYVWAALRRAGR